MGVPLKGDSTSIFVYILVIQKLRCLKSKRKKELVLTCVTDNWRVKKIKRICKK